MPGLSGFSEYIDAHYQRSVFDEALASGAPHVFHFHDGRFVRGRVAANDRFDVTIASTEGAAEAVPKHDIELVVDAGHADTAAKRIKTDPTIQAMGLGPIVAPAQRHHVKNKTLFPLMLDRQVIFFTLLSGKVVRGVIDAFSRYDVIVHLKGGVPVVLLRHAVYDLQDKSGRCYLKSAQEKLKDWQRHPLFTPTP
jgi:sRNA-binding regulator protein Hfq